MNKIWGGVLIIALVLFALKGANSLSPKLDVNRNDIAWNHIYQCGSCGTAQCQLAEEGTPCGSGDPPTGVCAINYGETCDIIQLNATTLLHFMRCDCAI